MKLNINSPCGEDWNSMKIGIVSRYCDNCAKDVFDFTNKSKEEILSYLIQNQNGSVCGRLKKSQLDFHHKELEVLINGLRRQKNNNYAFAILSMACLALVSCNDPVSNNSRNIINNQTNTTVIEPKDVKDSLTYIDDTLVEKPICKSHNNHLPNNSDSILSGKEMLDIEIMGEMIMEIDTSDTNSVHTLVDKMPEFKGGIDSLFSFLRNNLVYPEKEKSSNIHGKVYVNFIVDRDGSVTEPKILRGLTENCDNEVLRVMKLMPKWYPGEHKGKKVKVSYNLPINFSLSK
ncbi:MAG: energy transducer TonB [Vicingaceae bacterium]